MSSVLELKKYLEDHIDKLEEARPTWYKPSLPRLIQSLLAQVSKKPSLMELAQDRSLDAAWLQCVALAIRCGLELDETLGQAFITPLYNSSIKRAEPQLILGYRGLIRLALRSKEIVSIYAETVAPWDDIEVLKGTSPSIRHVPHPPPADANLAPDNIVMAYAVAKLRSGATQFVTLWKHQIDYIRNQSKSYQYALSKRDNTAPWIAWYDAMARKSAIRSLCRFLPLTTEVDSILTHEELVELGRLDVESEAPQNGTAETATSRMKRALETDVSLDPSSEGDE